MTLLPKEALQIPRNYLSLNSETRNQAYDMVVDMRWKGTCGSIALGYISIFVFEPVQYRVLTFTAFYVPLSQDPILSSRLY